MNREIRRYYIVPLFKARGEDHEWPLQASTLLEAKREVLEHYGNTGKRTIREKIFAEPEMHEHIIDTDDKEVQTS